MSRESGSEQPGQRTVAELLAEYGGDSQRGSRRRRRRAEDPSETAPHAIIDRVMSDSGQMRAVDAEGNPVRPESHRVGPKSGVSRNAQPPESDAPPPASPAQPSPHAPAPSAQIPNAQPPNAQPSSAPAPSPPASTTDSAAHTPVAGQAPAAGAPPGPAPNGTPAASPPSSPPSTGAHPVSGTAAGAGTPPAPGAPPSAGVSTGGTPAANAPADAWQRGEDAAPASGGANFWAQRFAAAGAPAQSPPRQQEPDVSAEADAEATIQQPAMPAGPRAAPALPPGPNTHVEGATEQLAPVRQPADPAEDTALVDYPQDYEEYAPGYDDADHGEGYETGYPSTDDDPYDFESYDDGSDDLYGEPGEADAEGADAELPAGLDEDYLDEEADSEAAAGSSGKEWAVVVLQAGAGLLGGSAVWFGFRWLWTEIAVAALVAALVVTGCLVFIARRYSRTDDMQTILFAVLVGLICTVSPAALLLIGQ